MLYSVLNTSCLTLLRHHNIVITLALL